MQHTVYLFDGFQLDVTRHQLVSSGGLVQQLNTRAMEALLLLVANAGELVEKRRLMQTVWPNAIVEDNNLNQCILAIRKALGETAGSNRYIMTVPGRGYRFVSPVRVVQKESLSEEVAAPSAGARIPRAAWVAIGAGACACTLLLAFVLPRVMKEPSDPLTAAVDVTAASGKSSPGIVLRLREPSAPKGEEAAVSSTALLARCLAARPHMKLRVQVQLVSDGGAPVWTGDYVAGAQDLLALQVGGNATELGCRELIASVRSTEAEATPH